MANSPVRRILTVLAVTIVIATACTSDESTGTIAADSDTQRMTRRTLNFDGIEREYFIHFPNGFDSSERGLPLVLAIHGYTSTATGFQAAHNLNPHADEHGYILVYPQGSHFRIDGPNNASPLITSWNDLAANQPETPRGPHCVADSYEYPCPAECGDCSRCAWTSCYDDVGFINSMLDAVQEEFSPDPQRIYLLGVSNGGMMALRLACNMSERFAAVAPIIAQLAPGYACGPDVDMPMLHLYGGKDNTVRHDGQPAGDGFIYTTAEETLAVWANSLSCQTGPVHWENEFSRAAGLSCTAWSDCNTATHEAVSCMDPAGAHEWPGQRVVSIPATCVTEEQYDSFPDQHRCPPSGDDSSRAGMDLVWNFMSRYRTGDR